MKHKSNFDKLGTSLNGAPYSPGVYVICLKHEDYIFNKEFHQYGEIVYYVGSSKNIGKRIYGNRLHPYWKANNKYDNFLVYVKFYVTKNYEELEKKLINECKPVLNKRDNG